ncbi:hypothetical protein HY479_01930 [Candidatus Uhrbacteria bacterium]|nr:hypothetical protein [Candidatus Uhrbacteria bacterium]
MGKNNSGNNKSSNSGSSSGSGKSSGSGSSSGKSGQNWRSSDPTTKEHYDGFLGFGPEHGTVVINSSNK